MKQFFDTEKQLCSSIAKELGERLHSIEDIKEKMAVQLEGCRSCILAYQNLPGKNHKLFLLFFL